MCGIAGFWQNPRRRLAAPTAIASRMVEQILHRGPDDAGVWFHPAGVEFGFRRLSIFDTSLSGHQPMSSRSGRFTLVFNGEVYNHVELRRELEAAGLVFRSGSDTEVLLEGIEHWGLTATISRARGMFAFAVWDRDKETLSLVRDRLGIKPLYLYRHGGVLAFASELRCFFQIPGAQLTVDTSSVLAYLELLVTPAPRTVFREVAKVEPGSVVEIRGHDLEPTVTQYWSLPEVVARGRADPLDGGFEQAVLAVRQSLEEAVALRLRADVPVGAFLSGGIDSSTVVALAQARSPGPVRTFTVGFDDPRFDESTAAREIAHCLGTDHTEVVLSEAELLDVVPGMARIFDEPFADPSQMPTRLISGVARRDVTVSLSGDGGDEIFCGYNRYRLGSRLLSLSQRLGPGARNALRRALTSVPDSLADGSLGRWLTRAVGASEQHPLQARLAKVGRVLGEHSSDAGYGALMIVNPGAEQLIPGALRPASPGLTSAFAQPGLTPVRRMMLADQATYLQDDLLTKLDRSSMSVALEARVPMLDHEVVELSWRLPDDALYDGTGGKRVLRAILGGYLPERLIDVPKKGFSVPVASWLRGALRDWAEELVSADATRRIGLLDPVVVRSRWERFSRSSGVDPLTVWPVIQLHAWCREWGVSA